MARGVSVVSKLKAVNKLSEVEQMIKEAVRSLDDDSATWHLNRIQIRILEMKRVLEGISSAWCTGVSAAWCPNCGDCTCDRRDPILSLDRPDCPLHGKESKHPMRPATPDEALSVALDYSEQFSVFSPTLMARVCGLQILSDWRAITFEDENLRRNAQYHYASLLTYGMGAELTIGGVPVARMRTDQSEFRWIAIGRHGLDNLPIGPTITKQSNLQNQITGFRVDPPVWGGENLRRDPVFFGTLNAAMRLADQEMIDAGFIPANARCLAPKDEEHTEQLEEE